MRTYQNQYPGPCRHCGTTVAAYDGIRRRVNGAWMTEHPGACPPKSAQPELPGTATPAKRPNARVGGCYTCGTPLAIGAGFIEQVNGRWRVYCGDAEACLANQEAKTVAQAVEDEPLPDVPAGHYAIPAFTGDNDLGFFRVKRPVAGKWAGRTFVNQVVGGHPDAPVRRTQARAVLEAIVAAGIAEAGLRYGTELGQCCRCNRHLTDETSRTLGIGPECRKENGVAA